MGFETVYGTLEQKGLEMAGTGACKVNARIDFKMPCKKVLSVNAVCFIGGCEQSENEVKVSGRVMTRVIYLDETDSYNSEEHSDTFSERFTLKDQSMGAVIPYANVIETNVTDSNAGGLDAVSIVNISLLGIGSKTIPFVTDIKGDAECRREVMNVSSFACAFTERFEEEESFDLDKNCEGILGVDAVAAVRDINCGDGKFTIKGAICANVIATKGGEDARAYSTACDWDFTKTITAKEIGIDDVVLGNVVVTAVNVKAEKTTKPEIKISIELMFCGHSVTRAAAEYVTDAFCFDSSLNFTHSAFETIVVSPQHNSVIDIEGNMTMPDGSPFIAKVLTVDGVRITSINVIPSDNRVTLEGVINANIIFECEEHGIHAHQAAVPFTAVCKPDGMSAGHTLQVSAAVLGCNIKARRGKELLVDARLSVSICANTVADSDILSDVTAGEAKARDDSAIAICIASDGETLWDIAKRTSVPSSEILRQNPGLETKIPSGERILIYRQQIIRFN